MLNNLWCNSNLYVRSVRTAGLACYHFGNFVGKSYWRTDDPCFDRGLDFHHDTCRSSRRAAILAHEVDVCFVDTWSCGARANSFAFRNSTVDERSPERSSGHNAVSCSGPRCVGNNVVRLVQLARSVSLAASLTIIQTIVSGSIVAVVLIWMGNRRRESD
jgi:hypothetical protein